MPIEHQYFPLCIGMTLSLLNKTMIDLFSSVQPHSKIIKQFLMQAKIYSIFFLFYVRRPRVNNAF